MSRLKTLEKKEVKSLSGEYHNDGPRCTSKSFKDFAVTSSYSPEI